MITHPRRWYLLSIGLGCAALVGLVGCGGQSAVPSQAANATQAAASGRCQHIAGCVEPEP